MKNGGSDAGPGNRFFDALADKAPPHLWFCVSAVFHYLGPAFAVLLFPSVGVLGVAWLRIATAATFFAPVTRPWRTFGSADCADAPAAHRLRRLPRADELLVLSGAGAAAAVAGRGGRIRRHDRARASSACAAAATSLALALAVAGTFCLIDVRWSSDLVGLAWALLNGVLFVGYVVLGHRLAARGAANGIANLGAAMAVALLFVLPFGFGQAMAAFSSPLLLGAAIGVGICSSVIPYICDQLAMSRLPRASFALMLSLLPLSATLIGVIVLAQIPGSPTSSASRWWWSASPSTSRRRSRWSRPRLPPRNALPLIRLPAPSPRHDGEKLDFIYDFAMSAQRIEPSLRTELLPFFKGEVAAAG